MAQSLSAKKRVRQNLVRRMRNRRRMHGLKGAIRKFLTAIHDGKMDQAQQQLSGLTKLLDQTAAKGTLHRNTASRYKSRLTLRLNKLRKSPPAVATA